MAGDTELQLYHLCIHTYINPSMTSISSYGAPSPESVYMLASAPCSIISQGILFLAQIYDYQSFSGIDDSKKHSVLSNVLIGSCSRNGGWHYAGRLLNLENVQGELFHLFLLI
jgi:hypothetical protein